jgi:hypothetical protein
MLCPLRPNHHQLVKQVNRCKEMYRENIKALDKYIFVMEMGLILIK